MTLAILDARDKEYVVVAAGADLIASYVQQAIAAGQTAQEVLDAILAAGLSEGVFPSEAAGLSGTAAGQYFWVGAGGTVVLYRNDAGVGTEIAELATIGAFAAPDGATKVGAQATGGNPTTLAAIYNRLFVWTEDYSTFQEAFDAAAARGATIQFRPNVSYPWPSATVSVSGKVKVIASGAVFQVADAITALEFLPGSDGSEWDGGTWNYSGSLTDGYNSASNAVLATGVQNGAGVAPTWIENIRIKNATFVGFGNTAVEFRYARNCGDENIRVINCGYAGVFCYSVDTYVSRGLFVNGLAGQLNTGVVATSELNAYGFTATALTGAAPGDAVDRVQDPYSRNILIENPCVMNVPTWHAIDTHGADGMIVKSATIINCRRGVVFTALTDRGASNCKAIKCTATNNFAVSATNGNGSYKKGEAFWDIGPTDTIHNKANRFEGCSCFGHGNPSVDEGAVTIANADDGFYGIQDVESQRVGWKFGSNIERATVDAITTNARHATVNPSVARLDGDDADIRVARWKSGERDPGLDVNVMVNGIVINHTTTGSEIHFEDFNLEDCTAGEIVSTSGFMIAALLTGSFTILADISMTGTTGGVSTTTVRFARFGRLCTLQLPINVLTGTGATTAMTLTGVPEAFRPSATAGAGTTPALDGAGGGTYVMAVAQIDNSGVITLTRDADNNTSAWTASGPRTLRGGPLQWLA